MGQTDRWLQAISEQMRTDVAAGALLDPERLTVREFMQRFGYVRRTRRHISQVRGTLRRHGLRTYPDFVGIWNGETISIELIPADGDDRSPEDPTVRIAGLDAAHRRPVSLLRDDDISTATTKMLMNDFSQLPVMQGDYKLHGIVSWKSIGQRYMVGQDPQFVRDCMEPAKTISINAPMLNALTDISEHGYVLVIGEDNSISGIVTSSDVTQQFAQLTGPFLLIGEIEGHLRNMLHGKFTLEQITQSSADSGNQRKIERVSDLTFGEYCRLLEQPDNWDRVNLGVDRKVLVEQLNSVREIRNDVMHFNTDGLDDDDIKKLEGVAAFFRALANVAS